MCPLLCILCQCKLLQLYLFQHWTLTSGFWKAKRRLIIWTMLSQWWKCAKINSEVTNVTMAAVAVEVVVEAVVENVLDVIKFYEISQSFSLKRKFFIVSHWKLYLLQIKCVGVQEIKYKFPSTLAWAFFLKLNKAVDKVRTFWEAHKNWKKTLPHGLYIYLVNVRATRKIFFKFCVLLKKSEL